MKRTLAYSGMILALGASLAHASTFTTTSPNNGALPSNLSSVGGIVLDLTGLNGTRVTSELAASTLFKGYANTGTPSSYQGNPLTIGIQTGFSPTVVAALGGGLANASVRITLYDGDSAPGNFDYLIDTLLINGNAVGANGGNFSNVTTQNTDGSGNEGPAGNGTGFRDNTLDTGFFVAGATQLSSLYMAVSSGSIAYQLNDTSPYDNYFDFTQGLDASQVNVGSGPVIVAPGTVPLPASFPMFGGALALLGFVAYRTKRKAGSAA